LAKTWQCLCLCLLKVKGTVENYIKNISGSSPIFALSIHTTFSQTQTGATVSLNGKLFEATSGSMYAIACTNR
jgi:hypothetical protein